MLAKNLNTWEPLGTTTENCFSTEVEKGHSTFHVKNYLAWYTELGGNHSVVRICSILRKIKEIWNGIYWW